MNIKTKQKFEHELSHAEPELNLAHAALLIARYLRQRVEIPLYLDLLDEMARHVKRPIQAAPSLQTAVERLSRYLFTDLKFVGNSRQYYHPENSFLNKVLDLRTGIPISLSLIYLEIGWRLSLPLWGVSMPRHFIVGCGPTPDNDPLYIDVFHQGRLISEAECMELAHIPASHRHSFRARYLRPAPKRDILYRMLLNLKQIYVSDENWELAYRTVDLMLVVRPGEASELRDRGLIAYRLERLQSAIFDIERYLFLKPHVPDEDWLKQHLELMEDKLLRLN